MLVWPFRALRFVMRWLVGLIFMRPRLVHGSAHFATRKEARKAQLLTGSGFILGKMGRQYITMPENLHVLAYGTTGSGKTTSLMIPNLISLPRHSFVVADPKGELAALTADYRRSQGNRVIILNPANPARSARYDPLSYLTYSRNVTADAAELAALAVPLAGHSKDDHFNDFAQRLVSGAILLHWQHQRDKAHLPYVLERLVGRGVEHRNAMFDHMASLRDPILRPAVTAFDEAGDREKGSFSTTMSRKLGVWMDEGIRAISSQSDFTFEDLIDSPQPTTVYLQFPIHQKDYYGAWLRMVVGACLGSVSRRNSITGQPLPRPLVVMVDEAGSMGYNASLASGVTYLRSANCRIVCAFQSPGQIQTLYPDAKTFQNCFEAWLISGGEKDLAMYRELSELIGDVTIRSGGRSKGKWGASESETEQPRRLIKPDELFRMPKNEQLVFVKSHAIKSTKAFYFYDAKMKKCVKI